ncbi:MAG: DUF3877 family protein [Eubacterium sp.]|nr:DUF3877 family protein [Eubacterium sp.]
MNYNRLNNNLISVIKEAQLKLGYESHPIGVNYTEPSLCHLLCCEKGEVEQKLADFCRESSDVFGKITFAKREGGYRLTVPQKGVDYVHSILRGNEFLAVLINAVQMPGCTIETVLDIFHRFSDDVHFEEVANGEFDYLVYFEDEGIDEFWYCFHDDELQLEYHRFIKEDYLDFDF